MMSKYTLLATYYKDGEKVKITVDKYNKLLVSKKNKEKEIAEFIFQRFYSRYIKPFEFNDSIYINRYKNGFSIMANCCLLIESYESFRNGWESTDGKSKKAFKSFFAREKRFEKIKSCSNEFYKNVRCGILHQAETTGGWKILRSGKLFDSENLTINATKFLSNMQKTIENYKKELESEQWDSELWDNLRRKMRSIIKNCKNP